MIDIPGHQFRRSIIIAGSRTVDPSVDEITEAIRRLDPSGLLFVPEEWTEIVCGCALGADKAGERWALARGIPVHHEPITTALVLQFGKYLAPKMRNRAMAERAWGALVFWDGTSGGSADMVCRMVARDKPVRVIPWAPAKR